MSGASTLKNEEKIWKTIKTNKITVKIKTRINPDNKVCREAPKSKIETAKASNPIRSSNEPTKAAKIASNATYSGRGDDKKPAYRYAGFLFLASDSSQEAASLPATEASAMAEPFALRRYFSGL